MGEPVKSEDTAICNLLFAILLGSISIGLIIGAGDLSESLRPGWYWLFFSLLTGFGLLSGCLAFGAVLCAHQIVKDTLND